MTLFPISIAAMTDPAADLAARDRVTILGVPMDCVSMGQCVLIAEDMLRSGRQGAIYAINPEKIVEAGANPALLEAVRSGALLIPDGGGAVLAARLGGLRGIPRVTGADLMPELCALAAVRGFPVFLFGARPGVAEQAAEALRGQFPGLRVVGCHDGYLTADRHTALIDSINASGARLLFVALGSPAQEFWIHANLAKLPAVSVCQGVGGTFDVLAGRVRRAPVAWRKAYLEWLYRLLREPARVRRLPRLLGFAWRVWKEGVELTTVNSG